jgi:lipopolysaccharide transport system ATP-binding protein
MSDETLVRVDHVSKKFCRSLKRSLWYGVQDIAADFNPLSRSRSSSTAGGVASDKPPLRVAEFWAVNDVSFELRRGECLGLIGKNGAGKTTLLKMINGLIKPDHGRIEKRGRVGAVIALGAGFNPILTGRENVYVNASVVGLSIRETDARLEVIVDFAEISDFIDSPVQNYSSGMQMRLGFAVATSLDPDILILDEVLAVGDAAFRAKCYNRIGRMQKNAAVIFVSHNIEQISRISTRVLMMARGQSAFLGAPEEASRVYDREMSSDGETEESFITFAEPFVRGRLWLDQVAVQWNGAFDLNIEVESTEQVDGLVFYGVLYDASGQMAASFATDQRDQLIRPGPNRLRLRVDGVPLATGTYLLGLTAHAHGTLTHLVWSYKQASLVVEGSGAGLSTCRLRATVQAENESAMPIGSRGR